MIGSECRLLTPVKPTVLKVEKAVSAGDPKKKEAKKEEGKAKDGGKKKEEGNTGACSEPCCKDKDVVKITGELDKMEANDPKFMDKVFELRDAVKACRMKNAKEARDKAAAAMKKSEDHEMLKPGFALVFKPSVKSKIASALHAYCEDADPKKKEAKKSEKGGKKGKEDGKGDKKDPCSQACCKDKEVVKIKGELAKMEANDPKFMDKVWELRDALDACRDANAEKASEKADKKMEKSEDHPMLKKGLVGKK